MKEEKPHKGLSTVPEDAQERSAVVAMTTAATTNYYFSLADSEVDCELRT